MRRTGLEPAKRQSGLFESGLPVVADDPPGHAGPLGGILAGLDWLARHRADADARRRLGRRYALSAADLVERLAAERDRTGAVLACAASGDRRHPAVGLWPVALRHSLRSVLVDEGLRKVAHFLDRYPLAVAVWPAYPFDPFLNLNTPADLAAAEAMLERFSIS